MLGTTKRTGLCTRVCAIALFASVSCLSAGVQQLVIHWKSSTVASASDLFKDRDGNPLDRGLPANGDGYLVTLGYFTEATAVGADSELFKGQWVPLTSGTAVGDSSSGYGYGNGMFSFTTVFTIDSDLVLVYPAEPAGYQVTAPHVITTSLPPSGHPVAIRFYDRNVADASALYNTVSNDDWRWPSPSSSIPVNLYLKASSGSPPPSTKWIYGSTFEDPSGHWRTSLGAEVTLGVTAGPGGSVTDKNGTYNYGQEVSIEAFPDAHMEFVRWEDSGVTVSTFQNTTVSMTNPRSLQAVFQVAHYEVTLTNPGGGGDLNGAGFYQYGTNAIISASPHSGFDFGGWQGDGLTDPNAPTTTTVALDRDRSYVAVFNPKSFLIEANATAGGNVSLASGPHLHSTAYDLNATPWRGYSFTGWTSESNSTASLSSTVDKNASLTVTGPARFTANFTEDLYQLTVSSGTGGSVTPTSDGPYSYSQQVAVAATPSTGYNFSHWSGDLASLKDSLSSSTDANMTVKAANVSLLAHFTPKTYLVEVNATSGGTVNLSAGPYEHFHVYELNVTAASGYVFTGWQGNSTSTQGLTAPNAPSTFLAISGPVQLTANFTLASYNLAVSSETGGSVQGGGTYGSNETPAISSTPSVGYQFSHWSGDVGSINDTAASTATVNMGALAQNLQLTANFSRKTYTLSANVSGAGDVNGSQVLSLTYSHGNQLIFQANPSPGWNFDRWTWSGTFPLTDLNQPALSLEVVGASAFTAHFIRNSYSLTVEKVENGDSNGSGLFPFDSNTTITATPDYGYTFSHWSGNATVILDTNASITTVHMPEHNVTVSPAFSPVSHFLTATTAGQGNVTGSGSFPHASTVTMTAIPNGPDAEAPRGYFFKQWDWNSSFGSGVTSENPYSFTIDSNTSLVATFQPIPPASYTLDLSKNIDEAGTTSGAGYFDEDNDRLITATPNAGYTFLGWSSQDAITFQPNDGNASAWINLEGNSTISAHFAANVRKLEVTANPGGETTNGGISFPHAHTAFVIATPDANHTFANWNIQKSISYSVSLGSKVHSPANPAFLIDGRERPEIVLVRGFTYAFNVNTDPAYPVYLSTSPESSGSYFGEYNDGVTGNRAFQGTLTFTVPANAPDLLFYNSPNTPSMGSPLRIISLSDSQILPNPEESANAIELLTDFKFSASFSPKLHTLSVTAGEGGSLADDPSGDHEHGTVVTITANPPDEHFLFNTWQGEGISDPNALTTTVTMLGSRSVTALYEKKSYLVDTQSSPPLLGNTRTESNELEFSHGTEISLVATPNAGNFFTHWSGASVSDPFAATTKHIIDGNMSVTANFQTKTFSLEVSRTTLNVDGSTHSDPNAGGTVGPSGTHAFGNGTMLEATASSGYEFVEWRKNHEIEFTVSVSAALFPNGAFSFNGQDRPVLRLVQGNSYKFKLDGNSTLGKKLHFSLTPDGLNAGGDLYSAGISGSPSDNNTITFDTTAATPILLYYAAEGIPGFGNEIRVVAPDIANEGDSFNATATTTSLNILADKSFTAIFRRQTHAITYSSIPEEGGFVNFQGVNPAEHGSTVNFMAHPKVGYRFDSWVSEDVSSEEKVNPSITITIDKPLNVSARFIHQGEINLSIQITPSGTGWTSSSGRYAYNSSHPIMANPYEGYQFVNWHGEGVSDANGSTTTIDLTEDRSIVAIFEPINTATTSPLLILALNSFPSEGGETNGTGQFAESQQVPITAIPNSGYHFLRWQGKDVNDANASSTTVNLTTDRSLVAIFEKTNEMGSPSQKVLAITVLPVDSGQVVGSGLHDSGSLASISANPNDDYRFQEWQGEGVTDVNKSTTTVDLSLDRSIVAIFEKISSEKESLAEALATFDPVTYLHHTSNSDLLQIYGDNLKEARKHFVNQGFLEDRPYKHDLLPNDGVSLPDSPPDSQPTTLSESLPLFDPVTYLNLNPDLNATFGSDLSKAKDHFFEYGLEAGRAYLPATFDPNATKAPAHGFTSLEHALKNFDASEYLKNPEVKAILGNENPSALKNHFIQYGYSNGLSFKSPDQGTIPLNPSEPSLVQALDDFDPVTYLTLNPELSNALGRDLDAATEYFIDVGHGLGDAYQDTSSGVAVNPSPDLSLDKALELFDPAIYLAKNPDVATILGKDLDAAQKHFIEYGYDQDREFLLNTNGEDFATAVITQPRTLAQALEGFQPDLYLTLNPDLQTIIGLNPEKLKEHFIDWGYKAGRATQPEDLSTGDQSGSGESSSNDLYSLGLAVFPAGSGSVNGAGEFGKGSDRSIEASPKPGYFFLEWRGEGTIANRYSNKTKVSLSSNTEIIAVFHYVGIEEELPEARIPGSTYVGWDWWQASWFGSYWYQDGNQWIYHESLGWIYLIPYSEDSVWMWIDYLGGWHWTSKSAYPFIRDFQTSTWLWFDPSATNPKSRLFFRYLSGQSTGAWESR